MEQPNNENDSAVPFASEEQQTLGEIRINHTVVANIVRIAAMSVPGVHTVGGGRFEGIADMFGKKEGERGVRVSVDEGGNYEIEVRVLLDFGVELAKTGGQIQQAIRDEVSKMTSKDVSRIDITIGGVHVSEKSSEESGHWAR